MEVIFIFALILLVGTAIYFIIDTKQSKIEPRQIVPIYKDDTLNKKMLKQAQLCVESVLTAFDKQLDYSDESVRILDQVIAEGWKGKGISQNSRERVVSTFGAYLGQTFINNHGGIWYEQPPKGSLPIVFVPKSNFEFSPADMLREKFTRMSFYDLSLSYYELVKQAKERLNALR